MSRVVLVHGAWHGGWVWQRLTPMVASSGHTVTTPTLTGLGDRAAEATRATSLEDHVQDVIRAIGTGGDTDVFVVAHSYAGIPVAIAADRIPDRLRGVVYLDARVPADGQRGFDVWPGSESLYRDASREAGDGWLIPPPDDDFGIRDAADVAWVRQRLTPQPLKTYEDRVHLRSVGFRVPTAAVICVGDDPADSIEADAGVPTIHITAGHDAMVSDPETLAAALLDTFSRF